MNAGSRWAGEATRRFHRRLPRLQGEPPVAARATCSGSGCSWSICSYHERHHGSDTHMAKKTKSTGVAVPPKLQGKSVFLAGNFYHQDQELRNLIDLEGGTVAA